MADGVAEMRQLAAALRTAGDKVMRKEVIDTLKNEARPLGEKAIQEGESVLPRGGGLGAIVGATPVTVNTA